jgi:hypothetical protein
MGQIFPRSQAKFRKPRAIAMIRNPIGLNQVSGSRQGSGTETAGSLEESAGMSSSTSQF